MDNEGCKLNLNGEVIEISGRDAIELVSLADHPGFDVFLSLMERMETGTRAALESVDTPLDTVRGLQGRLGVVTHVNELLKQGIPAWITAMSKESN